MAELLDKNRHFTCPNYKNIVVLIFKGEEIMWYWIIVALLVSGC
ncbi:MAG TPA: FHA domain-containing protein, partial [Lachnospiraceae bacterium]|nr:FHA domain-containing protein [Lachnospiraceae bacterium]